MSSQLSGESFLAVLQKSGLVETDRLKRLIAEQPAGAAPDADTLAQFLIDKNAITRWQADNLLRGRHKGFFLGKYRLLSLLGKGGMSSVYLAEHVLMRRRSAIKVLPFQRVNDSSYLARFHREAVAVAALDHPNIVRAYDIDHLMDQDREIHFLIMEYVDGSSLQDLVTRQGPLPFLDAADYVRQAAVGLAHAHQAGMVHRDIKPGNLLLDHHGVVKILDLGLARFFEGSQSEGDPLTIQHDEKVLGTADYLAPEQALDSHNVDARADIYSLGCTFYFLLTGHPPFVDGTLAQRLLAHQQKVPPPVERDRPDTPATLSAILQKMMAKKSDERYATSAAVAETLLAWLSANADEAWRKAHAQTLGRRHGDSQITHGRDALAVSTKPGELPGYVPPVTAGSTVVSQSKKLPVDSTVKDKPKASPVVAKPVAKVVAKPVAKPVAAPVKPGTAKLDGQNPARAAAKAVAPSETPRPPEAAPPPMASPFSFAVPATEPADAGPAFPNFLANPPPQPAPTAAAAAVAAPPAEVEPPPPAEPEPPSHAVAETEPVESSEPVLALGFLQAEGDRTQLESAHEFGDFQTVNEFASAESQDDEPPLQFEAEVEQTLIERPADEPTEEATMIAAVAESPRQQFNAPEDAPTMFLPPTDESAAAPAFDVTLPNFAAVAPAPPVVPAVVATAPAVSKPKPKLKVRKAAEAKSAPPLLTPDQRKWALIGGGTVLALIVLLGGASAIGLFSSKPKEQEQTAATKKTAPPKTTTNKPADTSNDQKVWATKREANVGPSGDFRTIGEALQIVKKQFKPATRSDRFTIKVAAGTYGERIVIERGFPDNVTIQGADSAVLEVAGEEPIVRAKDVEGLTVANFAVKADGHPVAIDLSERLPRCRFQKLHITGISQTGIAIRGAVAYSFADARLFLQDLKLEGSSSAVGVAVSRGTGSDAVDSSHVVFERCRFLGPLAAGVTVSGSDALDNQFRECIFADCQAGVKLLPQTSWREFAFVNNTFYRCNYGVLISEQPSPSSTGITFRRNLFVETGAMEAFVEQEFDYKKLLEAQMLGPILHNWTDRPKVEPDKLPKGELGLFHSGRAEPGIAFASTERNDPKFLAPPSISPQRNVGGGLHADDKPWIGAIGP